MCTCSKFGSVIICIFMCKCKDKRNRVLQRVSSQQQHNGRKVTIVFPAGESNIISGDRSCHFNIWAVSLTDCSATCHHAKINSVLQISNIQKCILLILRTVITPVSMICVLLLFVFFPFSNKACEGVVSFDCTGLMHLAGRLCRNEKRSADNYISNLLNNRE